jgi:hypothetical protein
MNIESEKASKMSGKNDSTKQKDKQNTITHKKDAITTTRQFANLTTQENVCKPKKLY